jgi:hypothetical protein
MLIGEKLVGELGWSDVSCYLSVLWYYGRCNA